MTARAEELEDLLGRALAARAELLDDRHEGAWRLFNGFLEGSPDLAVDVYAATLVLYNYAADPAQGEGAVQAALRFYQGALPWLSAALVKTRAGSEEQRRGQHAWGGEPARKIRENGTWYAVDLTLNMDASLYLDTRLLRAWAFARLAGARVLNTFAYTGSLGVAAAAGGAQQVLHTDLNRRFLNLAKASYTLNGLPVRRADFLAGDFWNQMNALKRQGQLFDCVFVDPPFFSSTGQGRVDLVSQSHRVINKVRPLVAHDGWLVTINNALFLRGADYYAMLEGLCADGYLSIEEIIPVPPDFTGYPQTRAGEPPVDPAPFNHPTKIAVLRVRRKDGALTR